MEVQLNYQTHLLAYDPASAAFYRKSEMILNLPLQLPS
ncbi:MAG: hypothetical protein RHS_5722 [Robinsoniella sp. RHS]|nr:MAG: hypothetical protein RHS_5722 [Robinsoniella sp. RHS]